MSYDDTSSAGSKTPKARDDSSNYFESLHTLHNISPSAKSPGINIPSPSSGSLRQRRSSLSLGFDHLRHAGGVNSIDAFARSWSRAASYIEITPARQSYVSVSSHGGDEEEDEYASRTDEAVEDGETDQVPAEYTHLHPNLTSFGTYGSFSSLPRASIPAEGLPTSVIRHAEDLFVEQQQAMLAPEVADKEREPLLVRTVETQEGIVQQVIVGQSTLPQTVFNSVNVLIGIGLLSLPLGIKYSGWLVGMLFLGLSAMATNHTAKLLARCLERTPNKALVSYSDIAYIAYGRKARVIVSIMFSMELMAACVALVVLFADSLHSLIPSISVLGWKIIAGLVLTPSSFLPLRILSFTSILGILSTCSIFLIVLINGLLKPEFPGSLLDPAPTHLFPQTWLTLPLSFGLLMSPWGGHGVFPNIYKDMRHPHKYNRAVNYTYWFTYLLDASMMVVGILMFGDGVKDEITGNILELTGYPEASKVAMAVFIAIIPLTKTPLNARPIITTLDFVLGVDVRAIGAPESAVGRSNFGGIVRTAIRIFTNASFVVTAIICPSFDRIMAFMGSTLCFAICVIMPLMFYLKIFGAEVGKMERVISWLIIISCSIMALLGTAFSFIPEERLGA